VPSLVYQILASRKRRLAARIRHDHRPSEVPMLAASNIQYELSARDRGLTCGGIGAVHLLARRVGLIDALDRKLHLLQIHLPYHESDHVLNIAYNILADGACLQDLELLRQDEVFLDALGARRIPDPTPAGDFCRRFTEADVWTLQGVFNQCRQRVWALQGPAFFRRAILDADGTLAPTTGECKQGMDISYDGQWGYHPLWLSLANTQEPLFLVNRSGNRPSHEGAAACCDKSIVVCRDAGFQSILLRGDTDFSQTAHLDRWDAQPDVKFLFGLDAMKNLSARAEALPDAAWKKLQRPARYAVQTEPRNRRERVKEQIVKEREYENIRLRSEDVAEFAYQPTACTQAYRVVVVRKNLSVEKGEQKLFDAVRYFFYLTNLTAETPADIVLLANDRCDQENLLAQLKGGVRALRMPVDNLVSNWAYMVMAALAWSLKAWLALSLPETPGRWHDTHAVQKHHLLRMEFKPFLHALILRPCQIIKTSRRILYRLLSWNPWQGVFLRLVESLRRPLPAPRLRPLLR
jgi:Transposase DDE domain group 1